MNAKFKFLTISGVLFTLGVAGTLGVAKYPNSGAIFAPPSSNNAPVILDTIVDMQEDEDFDPIEIQMGVKIQDPDGDALVFDVKSLHSKVNVHMVKDSLHIEPKENVSGLDSMVITATDLSGASVADTFAFAVDAVNDAPIRVSAPLDADLKEDFPVLAYKISPRYSDVDGDALSYSVRSLYRLCTPTVSSDSLYIRSNLNAFGVDSLVITVTDGAKSVKDTFAVNIASVNDAPIRANPIVDRIVKRNFDSTFFSLDRVFNDVDLKNKVDPDHLRYEVSVQGTSIKNASIQGAKLVLYPDLVNRPYGMSTIILKAVDDSLAFAVDIFSVNVGINTITLNEDFQTQNWILSESYSINNKDKLAFKILRFPTLLETQMSSDTLSLISKLDQNGSDTMVVESKDPFGGVFVDTVNIIVNPVQDTILSKIMNRDFKLDSMNLNHLFKSVNHTFSEFEITTSKLLSSKVRDSLLTFIQDTTTRPYGTDTLILRAISNTKYKVERKFFLEVSRNNSAPVFAKPFPKLIMGWDKLDTFDLTSYFKDPDFRTPQSFRLSNTDSVVKYRVIKGDSLAKIVGAKMYLHSRADSVLDTLVIGVSDDLNEAEFKILLQSGFYTVEPVQNYLGSAWIDPAARLNLYTAKGALMVYDDKGNLVYPKSGDYLDVNRGFHQFELGDISNGTYKVCVGCACRSLIFKK